MTHGRISVARCFWRLALWRFLLATFPSRASPHNPTRTRADASFDSNPQIPKSPGDCAPSGARRSEPAFVIETRNCTNGARRPALQRPHPKRPSRNAPPETRPMKRDPETRHDRMAIRKKGLSGSHRFLVHLQIGQSRTFSEHVSQTARWPQKPTMFLSSSMQTQHMICWCPLSARTCSSCARFDMISAVS